MAQNSLMPLRGGFSGHREQGLFQKPPVSHLSTVNLSVCFYSQRHTTEGLGAWEDFFVFGCYLVKLSLKV